MVDVKRVSVVELRNKGESDAPILLVCAYPTDQAFQDMMLGGAISFADFQKLLPSLRKDHEIVFY